MRKFLLIILTIATGSVSAQNFRLVLGPEFNDAEKRTGNHIIEADENNYFIIRGESSALEKNTVLSVFDNTTSSPVFEEDLKLRSNEKIIKAFNRNGKIRLFTGMIENKEIELVLREIDNKTGVISQPLYLGKISYADGYQIKFSPDNSKFLVVGIWISENGSVRKAIAKLFETNTHKAIWTKEVMNESRYQGKPIYTSCFFTDNAARFIYLFEYEDGEKTEKAYAVAIHEPNEAASYVIKIEEENKTLINVNLEAPDGHLAVTGEFIDGNHAVKAKSRLSETGFFLLTVDPGSKELKSKSYDYIKGETLEKLTYKVKNYINRNVKFFVPYKTVYINNCFYVVKYHGYAFKLITNGSEATYDYGREIIVLKYTDAHKLDWTRLIPRYAVNATAYAWKMKLKSSNELNIAVSDRGLHLVYYDNLKESSTILLKPVMDGKTRKFSLIDFKGGNN